MNSQKKKALVIFPGYVLPFHTGNRRRLEQSLNLLRNFNFEIDLLCDFREYFANNTKDIEGVNIIRLRRKYIFHHLYYLIKEKIRFFLYDLTKNPLFFYENVDENFYPEYHSALSQISKNNYDLVFVNYVWMTKTFQYFPHAKKILDTHDIFTDRIVNMIRKGTEPCLFHCLKRKDEKKGLNRADAIIAIQNKEAKFFRKLAGKPVFTVEFCPILNSHKKRQTKNTILFVGGNTVENIYGINYFLKKIWPIICNKNKHIRLHIAGNVCGKITPTERVVLHGYVDDISQIYGLAKISICPLYCGTGQKTKIFESLSYGVPVVATQYSIDGWDAKNSGVIKGNDDLDFAHQILQLLEQQTFYDETKKNILPFLKRRAGASKEEFNRMLHSLNLL